MKNRFLLILFFFILNSKLFSEELFIEAKNITLDKSNEITIFKNDVVVKTKDKTITSDFASYNKKSGELIFKVNIIAKDNLNNKIKANYAEYNKINKIFQTTGQTVIQTTDNYTLEGEDMYADGEKKIIRSTKNSILYDKDGNEISLENFEYLAEKNIFKSIGNIKIKDHLENLYEFSQIYIDTKKKEMLGTDIKAYMNHQDFKTNKKNDPRIFANSIKINNQNSSFNKSIFTLCEFSEDEKCPPWTIQASNMLHDNQSKTIYYNNAVIKVYNIPIFYAPRLSHPDPSVDRRSGFLVPFFSNTKNLGAGLSVPYFWAVNEDKNFTLTNKLYVEQNPLFLGEYHQAFKNSNLLTDFGYTKGYKTTSPTKRKGEKSHIFAKFNKIFKSDSGSENTLNISLQKVSDDKYLKLHKIKTSLVDFNNDILESALNFTHTNQDLFFGFNASVFETLKADYNDKYEYILPEIVLDKNLISNDKFGSLDLQTNFKTHNYDTNKLTSFLVNDFQWSSNNKIFKSVMKNKFLGNFKNINYQAKNVDIYKTDNTNELFGAIGLLSEIDFFKKLGSTNHLFTPKALLKYSPGSMRKEQEGSRLDPINAYKLNRLGEINNFETGNTATLGFDYNIKKNNINKLDFSVAQVINEKENKKFNSITGMDEKLSDLVGFATLNVSENLNLNYDFAIDQNYKDLNYTDVGAKLNLNNIDIDFNYLQENNHIGDQDYFKTKIGYKNTKDGVISFETKRNLITNSAEFYNLSYEYFNDCLRAGLVYRREFYNDSELEPENSLMFNITLTPFGSINSPTLNQ
jgi:LPS-assembly protein